MTAVGLLKKESELAFGEMRAALEGVSQPQAWAVLPQAGPDYLHTDGSIHGITLHVATCKFAYGSIAFRGTEIRWRDLADQVEKFEPNWQAALDYLNQAQGYWLSSWEELAESEIENEALHFSGKAWPIWKIIRMMIHHDSCHAGQIALLRHAVSESADPPPSVAEDIRKYCSELPSW
jgi:uncharacterized damage-inducible protein DinB